MSIVALCMCKVAKDQATCTMNLVDDLNLFFWGGGDKMLLDNMDQFSHFHCSNLKL
jgi:hypothetical protein